MLVVVSLIMVFVLQLTWTAGPRRIDADPRALLPADGYSTVMTVSTSQIFNVFMKYNFLQNLNSLFYFDSKYCN